MGRAWKERARIIHNAEKSGMKAKNDKDGVL